MIRALAIALALATCLLAAVPADAARRGKPRFLWATVNVCDTETHPDMMGVRASMPGDGHRTRMYMRFSAQYYSRNRQIWSDVKGSGVSRWLYVGSGRYKRRQKGYTFAFDTPKAGKSFTLRGVVDFKWKRGRRTIRTAHLNTKGGHPGTHGADPETYSSGLCEIR